MNGKNTIFGQRYTIHLVFILFDGVHITDDKTKTGKMGVVDMYHFLEKTVGIYADGVMIFIEIMDEHLMGFNKLVFYFNNNIIKDFFTALSF